jgi:endonuclease/exonuclease/phosphatase family metal-dependent hydrolase
MLKVMTWNVENLFRPGSPSGPTSDDVYRAKLNGLAATIDEEAPDALALQEVGDPEALDDLVALLDGHWHERLSSHPDPRQIRVAWLTTTPFADDEDIVAFPPLLQPVQVDDDGNTVSGMGRGALAVTTGTTSGRRVRLVTAHLKSKLLSFPNGRFEPRD